MIDPTRLLDQFLGAGMGGDPRDRDRNLDRNSRGDAGAGGGIGDLLGGLNQRARENPLASGALAGGLAAILLGSKAGRKLTGSAVKMGGMAVIGGLAYKAYQDYQARQAGTQPQQQAPQPAQQDVLPPPKDTPFMPKASEAADRARLLVTAMISAAKADGYIDAAEQKHIFERLDATTLDTESKAYVMDQLRAPLDLEEIVRGAKQPEVAAEVYAASLLAIDPDHPAEKAYLQMLAARLGLPDQLVAEIHKTAEQAGATVSA
jgi:uncharacterized membrane protein YebE (DUF533 family)